MKKRFSILFLSVSFVICAIGTLSSCKDYEEDSYADLVARDATLQQAFDAQISNLKDQISLLNKAKQELKDTLQNYVTRVELTDSLKNYATKEALKDSCHVYQVRYNTLTNLITNIQNTLNRNVTRTDSIVTALGDIDLQNTATKARLNALGDSIKGLNTQVVVLGDSIKLVDAKASEALEKAKYSLSLITDTLKDYATKKELQQVLDSAIAMNKTAKAYTDTEIKKVQSQVTDNTTKIGELQQKYDAIDQKLTTEIARLDKRVDDLTSKVEAYYKELTNAFNELKAAVTSVISQGTYNPVFGSFALPANVSSQVLAAYYGKSAFDKYNFPSDLQRYLAEGYGNAENTTLTSKDLEMVGGATSSVGNDGNGYIVAKDGAAGNAGNIYVTINPSNKDYTGVTLPLVNSQDVASPVTLGQLKRSDKVLTFGYTRAANNAFYEAPATITTSGIAAAKPRVDMASLKTVIKDAIQNRSNVNFTELATTLYSNMTNVLDANALKVSSSVTVNGQPEERNVYSSYAIAATAIKPLSYGFMYNSNYNVVPTISPLSGLNITFSHISQINPSITTSPITITVQKPVGVITVYDKTTNEATSTIQYKDTTYTVQGIDNLVSSLSSSVGTTMTDNVNSIIDSINGKINSSMDSYISKLNSYITRINSFADRINNLINSVNRRLQPTLLYTTNAGTYAQLSNVKYIPSQFTKGSGSAVALFATSYNAELLAPAYKKWIAVTNVFSSDYTKSAQAGDVTCKNILTVTNNNSTDSEKDVAFGKVTDGSNRAFKFAPSNTGYVYEIAYVTVDYTGHQTVNKYYVLVK
jgi:predicted  nucleic acid-binding Zn-ribbon protein